MIIRANCGPRISWTTCSLSLRCPSTKRSLSLPSKRNFGSIRIDGSFFGNRVSDNPSLGKELQVKGGAKLNRVGLTCEASQKSQKIERRIARAPGSWLSILVTSMPASIGTASIYPIKGLFFFYRKENREFLWQRASSFAAEVGVASVAIFGTLAGFTFHSQRGFVLQALPHILGNPATIALISIESAIPVTLIFSKRLERVREKLFEDVLRMQDVHVERSSRDELEWIDEQRERQWKLRQEQGSQSFFKTLTDPSTLNNRPLTKYFLTLPLNFVPVAGSVIFCWLNAMDTSTSLHHHYYSHLKGLSAEEEATIINCRRDQYQQFGIMAAALTLVPGFNVILLLTNAVGAALWAADIEKSMQRRR